MKKVMLSVGLLLSLATMSVSQDEMVTRKIKIRHADPYLVLLLISQGLVDFNLQPETSTSFGIGGFSGGFGGGSNGNSGFGGGRFGN